MESQEALSSLFSGMLQAGAAIVALVGGFLLQAITSLRNARELARNESRAFAFRRLADLMPCGGDNSRCLYPELSEEQRKQLTDEAFRDTLNPPIPPLPEDKDFSGATNLLLILIFACVVAPALTLWASQLAAANYHASQIQAFLCMAVFALALLKLPFFLRTASNHEGPLPQPDSMESVLNWAIAIVFALLLVSLLAGSVLSSLPQ